MKRIGVAASKISKGNTIVYNVIVVVIACTFSIFLFIVVASTVIFALALISYLSNELMPNDYHRNWNGIRMVCMSALIIIMATFNLLAVFINIKFPSKLHDHE